MNREEKTIKIEINPDKVAMAIILEKLRQETGYTYPPIDKSKLKKLDDNQYEYTFELPNIEDEIRPIQNIINNFDERDKEYRSGGFGIPWRWPNAGSIDTVDFYRMNQYYIEDASTDTQKIVNQYGNIIRERLKMYDDENPSSMWGHFKKWIRAKKKI